MSKVILYMAVSADGFVAGKKDNVDWVGDDSWQSYLKFVESCDVVIVGARTFGMMESDEFVEGVKYIIATSNQNLGTGTVEKRTISSASDMPEAERVGILGGGDLNGRLMQLGVIDEVILDIEPVILGQGIKLFGEHEVSRELRLINSKKLGENGIQNHYEVIK